MSTLPLTINGGRARGWALWLVPAVALAALVGWEIDWGRQLVRMPSAPPPVESRPVTAVALPEYQIEGGLPAHAEMVARTLFNATRRPAPVLAGDGGPRRPPPRPALPKPEHKPRLRRAPPRYSRRKRGKPGAPRVPAIATPARCPGRAATHPRRARITGTGDAASAQRLSFPRRGLPAAATTTTQGNDG